MKTPFLTCSKAANVSNVDTCCTEKNGGLFLQTYYWMTHTGREEVGQLLPRNRWTIHGLWIDYCDGSYPEYCDIANRQTDPFPGPNTTTGRPDGELIPPYTGEPYFTPFEATGRLDLLEYLNTYMVGRGQDSWILHTHEHSKHATCFSAYDPQCYGPGYTGHEDYIEYFADTIRFDRRLPVWSWLAQDGIVPSNETQYTIGDLEGSLRAQYSATPFLGCSGPRFNETEAGKGSNDSGRTVLDEVWFYFYLNGRPQDGDWLPTERFRNTSCAKAENAVWYYERTPESVR
ncbi:hypothetical protein CKM354_001129000 [Cercospora kikuchii]|uniref:Uncharacterized protein n=1 Tax=Cercospora kikuchii TaxID=84275 RepID=A0A9P3CS04_9PEZI|nr:uncharacterized protein CKM354_001129000 [Cercospora kikuchii]GIZ48222.1 hypothetical protein CKM354_001129000 [Cercospora kikuchii]